MRRGFARGAADWDRRFGGDDYLFGTEPNHFLVACRDLFDAGGRALCVADGEGRNSVWLAGLGLDVDAFDISPVGVAKARRLAEARGVVVRFEVAGVDDWRWPSEAYDLVAAVFIQFAPPDLRRRLFAHIATALRPGGVLVLQGYRLEQLAHGTGGPRVPEQLYTEAQLRSELADLDIERLESADVVVEEGAGHLGPSALIGLVARRP